jgi:hypothetical protein
VNLTEREKELIVNGLYLLESQILEEELHHEMAAELGVTKPEEVRILMNKIQGLFDE